MEQEEIKKLCEERGIAYKADFMESLTEEEFKNGTAKFNLTAPDGGDVEGVWGGGLLQKIERNMTMIISTEILKSFYATILLIIMEFYFVDVKLE